MGDLIAVDIGNFDANSSLPFLNVDGSLSCERASCERNKFRSTTSLPEIRSGRGYES